MCSATCGCCLSSSDTPPPSPCPTTPQLGHSLLKFTSLSLLPLTLTANRKHVHLENSGTDATSFTVQIAKQELFNDAIRDVVVVTSFSCPVDVVELSPGGMFVMDKNQITWTTNNNQHQAATDDDFKGLAKKFEGKVRMRGGLVAGGNSEIKVMIKVMCKVTQLEGRRGLEESGVVGVACVGAQRLGDGGQGVVSLVITRVVCLQAIV
eukprot:c8619_g1_i2.p2 GENE.c8619_g1_i2~~c8619_g1_i2.p2  ORF type:complete len:208 (+),score=52.92 c8619_g1_i2:712-1335(+)